MNGKDDGARLKALFKPNRDALLGKWAEMIRVCEPISQWTTGAELAWLAEAAGECRVVGEVGSYKGKSAKAMAWAMKGDAEMVERTLNIERPTSNIEGMKEVRRRIYCVDRFQDGTGQEFVKNLAEEINADRVILLPVESEMGAKCLRDEGVRFDLFFIDASHEKHDVLRDIELWKPLVRPGGILCGHDYCPEDGAANGVSAAVIQALPGHVRVMDSIWAVEIEEKAEILKC